MTPIEELFVKVAKHMLTQGKVSAGADEDSGVTRCRYRLGYLRCAVGCVIDDAHYSTELEGHSISADAVLQAVEGSVGRQLSEAEHDMLVQLQSLHDHTDKEEGAGVSEWPSGLSEIAVTFRIGVDAQRAAGVIS